MIEAAKLSFPRVVPKTEGNSNHSLTGRTDCSRFVTRFRPDFYKLRHMNSSSRRQFVKEAMTGIGFVTMPSLGFSEKLSRPLNIVCVGAHPDDPESGCGATLAKFVAAGHAVTIIYLTRGEAGIAGKSKEDAAAIRSKEAIEA
jgi:hypothetical protein